MPLSWGTPLAGPGLADPALDRGLAEAVGPAEVLSSVGERLGILAVYQAQALSRGLVDHGRYRVCEGLLVALAPVDHHEDVRSVGAEIFHPLRGRARPRVVELPRGAITDRFEERAGQRAQDGVGDAQRAQSRTRQRDVRGPRRGIVPLVGIGDPADDLAEETAPGAFVRHLQEQVGGEREPVALQNVALDVRQR